MRRSMTAEGIPLTGNSAVIDRRYKLAGVLRSREKFDLERLILLESAHSEHAETNDTALLIYPLHHCVVLGRPHIAGRVAKSHFEIIGFRIEAQFQCIAHDIAPTH